MTMPPTDRSINSKDPKAIIAELDRWVACHENGQYLPIDTLPLGPLNIEPDYGIQQVRDELYEFILKVISQNLSGTVLEIGIGHYGSNHFLWRLLFDRVITIEKSPERCRAFAQSYSQFYTGVWPGRDGRSGFIFGLSSDPGSVRKTYEATARKVDLLFIDGDHSYAAVLCDWLLYHHLVRDGGLIAFHDSLTDNAAMSEVPKFLAELERGEIDGRPHKIHQIVHTRHAGIAFYESR